MPYFLPIYTLWSCLFLSPSSYLPILYWKKAAAPAFLAARCQRQEAISHNNREHINGLSTLDNLENLEKKNYIPFRKSHIVCLNNYNHFALLHNGVKSAICTSILTIRRPHFHEISHVTFALKVSKSQKQFFLKLQCPKSDLNF